MTDRSIKQVDYLNTSHVKVNLKEDGSKEKHYKEI